MAEREIPKGRSLGVFALDHAAHLVGGPVGGVRLLGQKPGTIGIFVVAHAVFEIAARVSLVAQKELIVVNDAIDLAALFIQNDVVKANAIALWINV